MITLLSSVDLSGPAFTIGIVGLCGGLGGAVMGLGRRNTALTEAQAKAVDVAALQIAGLQVSDSLKDERIKSLTKQVDSLTARLDAAERMATSKDLILDVATHYGCPEDVLHKYRVSARP